MQKILFKKYFPYSVSDREIIYIEPKVNVEAADYIKFNYGRIRELCKLYDMEFVYLPYRVSELLNDCERLKYNMPDYDRTSNVDVAAVVQRMYGIYCDHVALQSESDVRWEKPMLLWACSKYTWYYTEEITDIEKFIKEIEKVRDDDSDVRFRFGGGCSEEKPVGVSQADWDFDEIVRLQDEIRERVEQLRTYGVDDTIIKALFEEEPKLSRLQVTADYRILLPDYDIEIKMAPLIKAVYLLFLRHPEGIVFKNMIDYRLELVGIYNKITKYEDFNRIESSIDALVDPTRNSINEKCSRIREAFVSELHEDIAKNYYITGGRLSPKTIKLDRGLVEYKY
jgi:hypothetical protein